MGFKRKKVIFFKEAFAFVENVLPNWFDLKQMLASKCVLEAHLTANATQSASRQQKLISERSIHQA